MAKIDIENLPNPLSRSVFFTWKDAAVSSCFSRPEFNLRPAELWERLYFIYYISFSLSFALRRVGRRCSCRCTAQRLNQVGDYQTRATKKKVLLVSAPVENAGAPLHREITRTRIKQLEEMMMFWCRRKVNGSVSLNRPNARAWCVCVCFFSWEEPERRCRLLIIRTCIVLRVFRGLYRE